MYQTARKIIISLLILAQTVVLWQGVFAAGLIPDIKDVEHTHCHQTTISEHIPLTVNQELKHEKMQHCHGNCCGDDCQCDNCICFHFALIPSYFTKSISVKILNPISFPIILDWQPVLLFKPPRQFRR